MIAKSIMGYGIVGLITIALIIIVLMMLSVFRRSGLELLNMLGVIKYKCEMGDFLIEYEEIIFRGKNIERAFSLKFIFISILGIISFLFVVLIGFGMLALIGENAILLKSKIIG
ncbi:hypothetical protein [Cetobacterium sp.]|uniref:hypothetical protein n=1 Tax=Cetobacterium sp. TaxID=2071632 RepID=UPI003F2E2620